MYQNEKIDQPVTYQIKVQGRLDEEWSDWFDGMDITFENDHTILTGAVIDQSALQGLLTKIWNLNLIVISVIRSE